MRHGPSITHCAWVGSFYGFHAQYGRGPVIDPVPGARGRRGVLAHPSPLEPVLVMRRAPLRQKVPKREPRAIPDQRWDQLFGSMRCDRDRTLPAMYVCAAANWGLVRPSP
jgi:hypothetical protein